MNQQHLIDSAIFDTTIAGDTAISDRQAEIDTFVGRELMQVVDEVIDQVDGISGDSERVLRLSKLDLDLGEIPYHEFRQQMRARLREELLLALEDIRHSPRADSKTQIGPIDSESAALEQLFYFLRHGYLPWYSRVDGADALEALLVEAIDSAPEKLVELLRDNGHHAEVLERIRQQFPEPVVERVMRLPSVPVTPVDSQGAQIDQRNAQLVTALLSGDEALIGPSWQALYHDHAGLLEETLRYYGQRAGFRQRLVAGLSAAQFDNLLRLLEPAAHGQVKAVMYIFEDKGKRGDADRVRAQAGLRECVLGYLLVEHGHRVDEESFTGSLLRQAVASANLSRPGDLAGVGSLIREKPGLWSRLFLELGNGNPAWERAVRRLPVAVLRTLIDVFLSVNSRSRASAQPADMSELATAIWSNAEKSKNRQFYYAQVLGRLSKGELIDFETIDSTKPGVDTAEQDSADLARGMPPAGEFAPREMLLSAELLSAAADSAGAGLTAAQLDNLKWRFIDAYLVETGGLFNASDFCHQYAEALVRQARAEDAGRFRDALIRALRQSNQPSSRTVTRRLADLLANEGGAISATEASTAPTTSLTVSDFCHRYAEILARPASVENTRRLRDALDRALRQSSQPSSLETSHRPLDLPDDENGPVAAADVTATSADAEPVEEAAALETIYIANAGAVLIAPYLPRLFERLGLTEKGQFKNRNTAERGVHCLQFLVNESTSSPEYQLVLNKLLCGIRPGLPICRGIELANDDRDQLEGLLGAVIENWKALGNTSVAGLRESFLQRNGRLQLDNDAWHLAVEARPFDMLLDQLPWSFSMIKFAWMDRVIYVEWR